MAVTVSRTISDGLDVKIRDNAEGWGTQAAWWQWVKAETKREIQNKQLRAAEALAAADLEATRATILSDTTLDG